jgi:TRAP-type C4-dicarboxylate transport system permease small subunit
MQALRKMGSKAALVFCLALALALSVASTASAAITIDAKDFTEPVESGMSTAAPIVIAFIAAVFTVTFVIRWIQKRANSAK